MDYTGSAALDGRSPELGAAVPSAIRPTRTKGYDAASQTYKTTFSEINVACETCHGPASRHVDWLEQARPPGASDDKGSAPRKAAGRRPGSSPTDAAKFAVRDAPAVPAGMNSCVACQRPAPDSERRADPGATLEDSYRLALLTAHLTTTPMASSGKGLCLGLVPQSKMHQNASPAWIATIRTA